MESFSELEKCGEMLKWDICYATCLGLVAETLIINSPLSECILTELVNSKYSVLHSVAKGSKDCHPSL